MILIILSGVLFFISVFKTQQLLPFLVTYFVLFDMFDGFYEELSIISAIRYLVPLSVIFIYLLRERAFKKADLLLFIWFIFLVILFTLNSGELAISVRYLAAIFITFLMIPVGRNLSQSMNFFREFQPFNRFLLYLIPVYIFVANYLNFGNSYSESFTTGFLITSRIYIIPVIIFLGIYYLFSSERLGLTVKLLDTTSIILNIAILIINTRRTPLLMLVAALFVFAIINRKALIRLSLLILINFSVLAITFPLYRDILTAQIEQRSRILQTENYEEEARFMENKLLAKEFNTQQSIRMLLFGIKFFDSYDFGKKYFWAGRPIHSDISMLIFSTGLIGFILFIFLNISAFFTGWKKIAPDGKDIFFPFLSMLLLVLIPGRLIGTLTFAPLLILILSASKNLKYFSHEYNPASAGKSRFSMNQLI